MFDPNFPWFPGVPLSPGPEESSDSDETFSGTSQGDSSELKTDVCKGAA